MVPDLTQPLGQVPWLGPAAGPSRAGDGVAAGANGAEAGRAAWFRRVVARSSRWLRVAGVAAAVLGLVQPLQPAGAQAQQARSPDPQAATTSEAQTTLVADRIRLDASGGRLVAEGNVEIFHGDVRLTARRLTYDRARDRIEIEGPLYITQGNGQVFQAAYAELSTDLRNGILQSARLVLSRQIQIAAAEMERSEGRYTRLYKAVSSSCRVCPGKKPVWQVRAQEIVHDAQEGRLHFRSAQLRVLDVPVFYLPRLSIPDPSVQRARGFLAPSYRSSSALGTGITVPYFIPLGDYADLTLAPMVFSGGSRSLTFSGRKRWHNARLDLEGALTRDGRTASPFRGYILADGTWSVGGGYRIDGQVQLVSDKTYGGLYGFGLPDRLTTSLGVTAQSRDRFLSAEIAGHYSTRTADINAQQPSRTASFSWRQRRAMAGNSWGAVSLEAAGYLRPSKTDGATGRDGLRAALGLDWSRRAITGPGLVVTTQALARTETFAFADDSAYPAPITRSYGGGAIGVALPLARISGGTTTILTPAAQLVWTPRLAVSTPNEDSTFAELDSSNLMQIDRLSGLDAVERGLRLNLSLSLDRQTAAGTELGLTFGQVLRARADGQFTQASGLAGVGSDMVLGLHLARGETLSFDSRLVLDETLSVSRNETRLAIAARRLALAGNYLWKEADTALGISARSTIAANASYRLSNNWQALAEWRHDFATGRSNRSRIGMAYRNECISVDFSLTRQFNSASGTTPDTSIGLDVELAGFGARKLGASGASSCSK